MSLENKLQRESNIFKTARLLKNYKKNKYCKVLPNEKSRVRLSVSSKDDDDYINANFIPARTLFSIQYSYIATQAPLPETFGDFWRMVIDYRCRVIVMLTETSSIEDSTCIGGSFSTSNSSSATCNNGGDLDGDCRIGECSFLSMYKAHRYWPKLGEKEKYGKNIVVETISHKIFEDVVEFEFLVSSNNPSNNNTSNNTSDSTVYNNHQRRIHLFQYIGWPDMCTPKNSSSLMYIMNRIDKLQEKMKKIGPLCCHCSAGIGRTGSFVAIHIIREQMKTFLKEKFSKLTNNLKHHQELSLPLTSSCNSCAMTQPLTSCSSLSSSAVSSLAGTNTTSSTNHNCNTGNFQFDVYNVVKLLKQHRIGMIQKKEQYVFVYQTVLEEARKLGIISTSSGFDTSIAVASELVSSGSSKMEKSSTGSICSKLGEFF